MIKATQLLVLSSCVLLGSCSQDYNKESTSNINSIPVSSQIVQEEYEDDTAQVIILLGQSNMEGDTYADFLGEKLNKSKFLEYQHGYKDVLISYVIPWNSKAQTTRGNFVPTTLGMGMADYRFGPEVGLAEYLHHENYKNVYLVKYAYGGTTLQRDWRSPSSGKSTGGLYTGAVSYILNAMKVLERMNLYPEIKAICWMQGESDSEKHSTLDMSYYDLEKNFISDLRNDLAYYAAPSGIGFVDAGITIGWLYHQEINSDKEKVAAFDPTLNVYFSTIEEKLEYWNEPSLNADNSHYDALSEIKLGNLFGEYAAKFLTK